MKTKEKISFTCDDVGYMSVQKQQYAIHNGQELTLGEPDIQVFCPGDFVQLESFAPSLMPIINTIWTPEVIAAQQQ